VTKVFHIHKPKKIHWRRFINRKMIAVGCVIVAAHFIDAYWRIHMVGKGGEMLLGVTLEHFIFGVPIEE
jgi:hypothetical protein